MKLVVYSRRWAHDDVYTINKTENGWYVRHLAINGECDKTGSPYLFENLDHDSISYPSDLGICMEYLWDESKDKDESWLQERLNELSEWIKNVEKSFPSSEFWKQCK